MTVDIANTIFFSSFSGLSNTNNADSTYSVASQTLSGNEIKLIGTHDIDIENENSITSIMVNFSGVETVWRPINGKLQVTIYDGASTDYDLILLPFYTGSTLSITVLEADNTGSSNTIPAIDFVFRVNVYLAPF